MGDKGLTKREKIEAIIAYVEKHKLTAYEIGTYAQHISIPTVDRIIKRETRNPSEKNLDIILEYIEKVKREGGERAEETALINEPVTAYHVTQELLETQRKLIKTQQILIDTQQDLVKERNLRVTDLEKKLAGLKKKAQ